MTDSRLSFIFFEVAFVLCLVAMVLGPFGIDNWSIAASACACFLAVSGMYLAFHSWKEPDDAARPSEEQKEHKE